MRITLVIQSLSLGGAERIASSMANHWADKGWPVTMVTLDHRDKDFYCLHNRVTRISLNACEDSAHIAAAIKNNIVRILRLRKAIRSSRPETVISFIDRTNVLTILATAGFGIRTIVSERVDPSQHDIGHTWALLRRLAYRRADAVVTQSPAASEWVKRFTAPRAVHTIPNPAPRLPDAAYKPVFSSGLHSDRSRVAAMGRLAPQKGFDLLLDAFKHVSARHPNWDLVIFGEGEAREILEKQARDLGLADRIVFAGRVADPIPEIHQCQMFVLSSRYEGFPNALVEAMACGLPVISFDCPSGPCEIVRHGIDGLLVPPEDTEALAASMHELMANDDLRARLAARAPEVKVRFDLKQIMSMWEAILVRKEVDNG